ncbi:hypothetical protein WJX81_000603 [Elliptochloris bilobata]|uniref:Uncharacterized protein n=1 Tax=Elliptochloris bilobata TaxID=381761 RepID=A0AAW1RSY2_9CHLO
MIAFPTSRRAQFHGVRTTWHDLLGRNCPRFGIDTLTVIQLPHPKAFGQADAYKVQLAFDGDRVLTPWLKLIGKGAPDVPLLDVALMRSGAALASASAKAVNLPDAYLYDHHALAEEFRNATAWPKHLLVQYRWQHAPGVDATAALYLAMAAGLGAFLATAAGVLASYDSKLRAFVADLAGENGLVTPEKDE